MRIAKVSIAIMLLLAGCGDEFVGPSATGVIMPLKVGNQWIGRWTRAGSVASRIDTLTIVSEVQRGNERWYKGSDGDLYINRPGGLWQYSEKGGYYTGEAMLAKYPAALNDTFGIRSATERGLSGPFVMTEGVTLLAKDTAIGVSAGTYSCNLYAPIAIDASGAYDIPTKRNYYAPNIGPIRKVAYDSIWELVSVTLR